MLEEDVDDRTYFLWRLIIDHRFQGLGFGSRAVAQLVDYVRTRPDATTLLTSVVQCDGSPLGFYERLGFRDTGTVEDGEAVLRLDL